MPSIALPLPDSTTDVEKRTKCEGKREKERKNGDRSCKKRVKSHFLYVNSFFVGKCADAFDPGTNLRVGIHFEFIWMVVDCIIERVLSHAFKRVTRISLA